MGITKPLRNPRSVDVIRVITKEFVGSTMSNNPQSFIKVVTRRAGIGGQGGRAADVKVLRRTIYNFEMKVNKLENELEDKRVKLLNGEGL